MDILGAIGLALVLLAILAFVHVIAVGVTGAVVMLIIGIVLLAIGTGHRLGRLGRRY